MIERLIICVLFMTISLVIPYLIGMATLDYWHSYMMPKPSLFTVWFFGVVAIVLVCTILVVSAGFIELIYKYVVNGKIK